MAAKDQDSSMEATAEADAAGAEWYLARDGQQYGPITQTELRKLLELKHLKDDDLLWCDGLEDWKTASEIGPQILAAPLMQADAAPEEVPDSAAQFQPEAVTTAAPVAAESDADPAPLPAEPAPRNDEPAQLEVTAPLPPPGAAYGPAAGGRGMSGPHPVQSGEPMWRAPHPHGSAQHPPNSAYDAFPGGRPPQQMPPQGGHHPEPQRPGPHPAHYPRDQRYARQMGAAARATVAPTAPSEPQPRKRSLVWLKRAAVIVFFVSTLSAAGWYLYPYRDTILATASSVIPAREDPSARVPPMAGYSPDPAQTDEALQKSLLWRTLKREFPDWYGQQLVAVKDRLAAGEEPARIGAFLLNEISLLRRKNALNALSATPPRLRAIASTFSDALVRVAAQGADSCHAVVTAGEAGPRFLGLMQSPELTAPLQIHLAAIFEAIAEGRRTPRVWPQPRDDDFGVLVVELEALGWTQDDLKLFSDNAKLAVASPADVCRLVTQWYQGQLRVKDPDIQLRLLADALRPLISG